MSLLAFRFQSPGPILFELGPVAVRWYGFLIAMAVIIGLFIAQNLAKRKNIDPEMIGDLVLWLVIGALPCARIYYVLFEWERYAGRPGDMIAIWQGGIAIHGAIIGGTLATVIFARIKKQSFWGLMDVVMPSLILGQAIGRWGNFFNSEAFGVPTDLPWGLYIPPHRRPMEFLTFEYFHPTFLYESVWNLMVFVLLMALFFWGLRRKNNLKTGTLVFVYLITYSLGRVWIEGFRTDSLMVGDWRVAQIISVSAIALGLFGLFWLYIAKRPLPFNFDQ
ncbi:prolipoprotein diacylglyceryl transferase [Cyanobacterium stanieri LEGE 03274]|uniref:Phosphatidylglycerol--prolipoprotein diacylglyceryl transferase n=1 Tax=Cyanobacterium stanieri LEGE 03274 TaxID=1828756 RepID=A0ABR9V5J6_9CHRO|nr:prolipoprotein diacylglyceryl transferase [Cyanobacterium stanieri]MBE9223167.1 prolipoprotein diacylglyceryl transferase [Cyanobacterium stanieri LEGE 03274]